MECEFCHGELSTRSSLLRHQRTSKACLSAQGRPQILSCHGCSKEYLTRSWLEEHENNCPVLLAEKTTALQMSLEEELRKARELLKEATDKISHLETKLLVSEAKLELQTANVAKQTTNNITLNLAELTPELGLLLAEKITQKEFWEGQRAIGRVLRDLRDPEDRPFYAVKDENRLKYEIRQGDKKLRDDRAEKIIESVKTPVREKIGTIKSGLIDGADPYFATRIMDQAVDCLSFSNSQGNARFLQGLSSKNELSS